MKIRILTETHEHQGQPVEKGTILDVDDNTGKHFVAIGAAEPVNTPKKKE